jgi:MFS family permease
VTDVSPSLWRNRDFNLMWVGHGLSLLGTTMSSLAMPLMVLWLTGSAVWAGAVGTVSLVVMLVVGPVAGVIADRADRRALLLGSDIALMAGFALLGTLIAVGHCSIGVVLAVTVVDGVCSGIYNGAVFPALRNIAGKEHMKEATARTEARGHVISLVGPPLGGVAYGLGRVVPFFADAVSYLFSITALLLIRTPFQERVPTTRVESSPLADFRAGFAYLVGSPFLRAVILIAAPLNFSFNGVLFGIVVVLRNAGVSPPLIGLTDTIFAGGGLLGALLSMRLLRRFGVTTLVRVICVAGVPLFLAILLLPLNPVIVLPVALLVIVSPPLNAGLFGHVSETVPDELQGRVYSAILTSTMAFSALAPLVVGTLVHHWGATGMVIAVAAAQSVSAVTALTSKGIRELDAQSAMSAESVAPSS